MRDKKLFILLSLIIIFIAALPRSIEVLANNYLFGFDQGLFFMDVKNIVIGHKLPLIGSFTGGGGGLFQGPGWYYLLSIPFFLFKGDPFGAMILMLILGLLTVGLSIYFGRKMFGIKTGLLIGLLIAISPAIISQSRFIWPPFPISLITVFFLYYFYKSLGSKGKFFPVSTFLIGLMSSFEIATAGTLFLQFLLISPFLFYKKLINLRSFLLSILTFIIPFATLILFNFRHGNILLRGILNASPSGGKSTHQITLRYVEQMMLNHFDNFKYGFLSSFYSENYIWILIVIVLLIGLVIYLKDKKINSINKLFLIYLLSSPLTLFLAFALYLWPMWQWWILELIIFYNFAFGVLFIYLLKRFEIRPILAIVILYFIFSFTKDTVNFYKNDLHDYGGTAKIKGKEDALDYIYKDARGKKFGLLVFSPPVYTFPYDYLLWWYAQRKYGYLPYSDKNGIFYLLIEPDSSKPWSYKGWLETVIKTGTVLKTVTLPSGFIVQKRSEI